jgi:hypothetical protein
MSEIINDGAVNDKLTSPTITMYSGPEVLPIWVEVAVLIAKAAAWGRGEYLAEDVLVLASEGKMQIWVFRVEGKVVLVGVTEILTYPRCKICNIYALAGYQMVEMWGLFADYLKTWLKANGIQKIQTTCRTEIADKITCLGFEPLVHVMGYTGKDLS